MLCCDVQNKSQEPSDSAEHLLIYNRFRELICSDIGMEVESGGLDYSTKKSA